MKKLLCCFVLAIGSAVAGSIITVSGDCTASADMSGASVSCGAMSGFGDALFQENLVFTVTAGSTDGFVATCFSGFEDSPAGGLAAGGFYGGSGANPSRAAQFDTCGPPNPQPFTRNVPIESGFFVEARAVSAPPFGTGGIANVSFNGFEFFDASMKSISEVSYTLDTLGPVPTPEPAASLLLASGILVLALRRRGACP